MVMQNIININAATPLLLGVPNSQINPPWIRLFEAIINAVGAPNSIVADEFQTYVLTARSPETELQALRRKVKILENEVQFYRTASRSLVAAKSQKSVILDDVTTNADEFPVWVDGSSAARALKTSSTKWKFNPSTGLLTSTQFAISGGTAAGTGTGMYGVAATSVLFAVNGLLAATVDVTGITSAAALVATTGFGCNSKAAQTAFTVGAAAPAGGVGAAAGAYDTAAHRDALITLVNNIRTALINNGIAVL